MPTDLRGSLGERSHMLTHLLYCRGFRTVAEIDEFFSGKRISHDPFLLPDMDAAVARICQAIQREERIAVYGDFDCDGITSAAVLAATLEGCGVRPVVHIPTRADGHGLQIEALATLADAGIDLIITADCGVNAMEEVAVARGMGMDVVVTDHHEARLDGSRPACPTVDPTLHESQYPCRFLCGAGVAYKLAQAIATRYPGAPNPDEVLDLVALGTVADVVPLQDENRSLVMRGLESLRYTQRPGLLALFASAGVDQTRIDPVSVGFYLAPRINAANRMATPRLAYDLLTASDAVEAAEIAAQLSRYNEQRQLLVAEHFERISLEIGPASEVVAGVLSGERPPILIVFGAWPSGISGLLASKLVDAYGLPAFVGAGADDGTVAVSARGVPGVHIDEMLEGCEASIPGGLFLGHGGHARAGGFRVPKARLELARSCLEEQAARQIHLGSIGAVLSIDAEISLDQVTIHSAQAVRGLAPFGMDFSEPLFLARDVILKRRAPVGGGKHARLCLQRGSAVVEGIAFHIEPDFLELPLETRLDVVFHLQTNEWKGFLKPEIQLRDWRPSEEPAAL